jgi:hypothetical protein
MEIQPPTQHHHLTESDGSCGLSVSSKSLRVPIDVTNSPQAAHAVHSTAGFARPSLRLSPLFSSSF